jgi:hypothetical protein
VFLATSRWAAPVNGLSSDPGGFAIYGSCHCFLNKYSLDVPLLCVQMSGIPNMRELIFPHDKPRPVIPNTGSHFTTNRRYTEGNSTQPMGFR